MKIPFLIASIFSSLFCTGALGKPSTTGEWKSACAYTGESDRKHPRYFLGYSYVNFIGVSENREYIAIRFINTTGNFFSEYYTCQIRELKTGKVVKEVNHRQSALKPKKLSSRKWAAYLNKYKISPSIEIKPVKPMLELEPTPSKSFVDGDQRLVKVAIKADFKKKPNPYRRKKNKVDVADSFEILYAIGKTLETKTHNWEGMRKIELQPIWGIDKTYIVPVAITGSSKGGGLGNTAIKLFFFPGKL